MGKFINEWEPPRLEEKESSLWWLWLIILFVAIGLVVVFLMQQSKTGTQTQSNVEQIAKETLESSPAVSEPSTQTNVEASNAPEMNSKCTAVAGIVPGTLKKEGSKVTVSFKNNGKVGIEGSYFEFSGVDKKAYRKNSDAVAQGETVTYTVDLDDAANELGSPVKAFVVFPIQEEKACMNQRMVVIENS